MFVAQEIKVGQRALLIIMFKISLGKTPKRRMSDTEENPLEETEEYGEIEMQEEDDEEEEYPGILKG